MQSLNFQKILRTPFHSIEPVSEYGQSIVKIILLQSYLYLNGFGENLDDNYFADIVNKYQKINSKLS